jgi:hypothetical protein
MHIPINMSVLKVKFESEIQILAIKTLLEAEYGCRIRPRGRHSDRKKVLGSRWYKWTQNDIPWRKAETVAFYKLSK